MAKTINSYVGDAGEITITVSSADVTAIAAFTTAEAITIDGAVRKFEETQPKTREFTRTYVAGDNSSPIVTASTKESESQWTLTLLDDYSKGAAGEWGTDNLAAYEIMWEFFKAKRQITQMNFTPAGGATGEIESTLTNIDVIQMPHPMLDADVVDPQEAEILLIVEDYTRAAHA